MKAEHGALTLAVPIFLVRHVGLVAAAMLAQAAYLSALKNGWFDLPQTGSGASTGCLFARLGSWEAVLGAGVAAQAAARKKLATAVPGLLEVRRAGVPARLQYRVDQEKYKYYLQSLSETNNQDSPKSSIKIVGNQQSRFAEIANLDSRKSSIKICDDPPTIPKSFPQKKEKEPPISPHASEPEVASADTPPRPPGGGLLETSNLESQTPSLDDEVSAMLFGPDGDAPDQADSAQATAPVQDAEDPEAGQESSGPAVKSRRGRAPSPSLTLRSWLERVVAEEGCAIDLDDPVHTYAEDARIPPEFIELQWFEFKQRYLPTNKLQPDWRAKFRNSVRSNWFHLWYVKEGEEAKLTTVGEQAWRVFQAQARTTDHSEERDAA